MIQPVAPQRPGESRSSRPDPRHIGAAGGQGRAPRRIERLWPRLMAVWPAYECFFALIHERAIFVLAVRSEPDSNWDTASASRAFTALSGSGPGDRSVPAPWLLARTRRTGRARCCTRHPETRRRPRVGAGEPAGPAILWSCHRGSSPSSGGDPWLTGARPRTRHLRDVLGQRAEPEAPRLEGLRPELGHRVPGERLEQIDPRCNAQECC